MSSISSAIMVTAKRGAAAARTAVCETTETGAWKAAAEERPRARASMRNILTEVVEVRRGCVSSAKPPRIHPREPP